jgi:hypothetical protein
VVISSLSGEDCGDRVQAFPSHGPLKSMENDIAWRRPKKRKSNKRLEPCGLFLRAIETFERKPQNKRAAGLSGTQIETEWSEVFPNFGIPGIAANRERNIAQADDYEYVWSTSRYANECKWLHNHA